MGPAIITIQLSLQQFIAEGGDTLLGVYIGLLRYREHLRTKRPFIIRNVMDSIASIIYRHFPLSVLPPHNVRLPSILDSDEILHSRYHLVSLFEENYGKEGFAMSETPLVGIGNHVFSDCPACNEELDVPDETRLAAFYRNQAYIFSGQPLCIGCDGTGYQGNFYLSSLLRDVPPLSIPHKNLFCCENLAYSYNGKAIEFMPKENGFHCYNCVTKEGESGQHFALTKLPSTKCLNCNEPTISVSLVANCRICHYSIFQNKIGLHDNGYIWVEE